MPFRHVLMWGLIHRRENWCMFSLELIQAGPNSTPSSMHRSFPAYFTNCRTQRNSSAILTRVSQCFEIEIWRLGDRKGLIISRNPRSASGPLWFTVSTLHVYQENTKLFLLEKMGKKNEAVSSLKGVNSWTWIWFSKLLN